MTTTYSKRENAFEKGEHRWSVEDHALIWTRPAGDSLTLPWKDVGAVRAAYTPTRARTWRHVFELTTRKGSKLLIDNSHFRGIADFEDRSPTFVPFVLACLDRVVAQAPDARASVGSSPAGYFGQLLFMLATMALVIFVLVVLPSPLGGLILLKLLLIAVMLPAAAVWAIRARPRRASLTLGGLLPGLPKISGNRL
ncbi:hypothetical protein [Caulobacter sp. NIBR1757]|uniref:hypothetical protein n=1 Tax=Caulobacter sp. NIBR1757 TaxID=3016000 RepID=UPI0022F12A96|nr:hypothetical protein [Caulobacter sp. NIBR1757]WGM39031.1 hypothetical protein AMEJIAPC_01942 [Caulobacter sp. NIBR1757]